MQDVVSSLGTEALQVIVADKRAAVERSQVTSEIYDVFRTRRVSG